MSNSRPYRFIFFKILILRNNLILKTLKRLQNQNFESKTQTDVVVLDFSKAFDVVPHQRLLHKLDHYGIRGTTLNWIQNFLTNRT